jgi:hypothetical protein
MKVEAQPLYLIFENLEAFTEMQVPVDCHQRAM